jgi:RimJ/RimL family protein N-acetyltransferase
VVKGVQPRLRTARLDLIAATAEHCQADLEDRAGLARLLDAEVSEAWPPHLLDADALTWCKNCLRSSPWSVGWTIWYLVSASRPRRAIGVVGFKGPPCPDGLIEVGYALLDEFHRQGLGTEAVSALVEWAFSHGHVSGIVAHTYPDLAASLNLLRRLGFREVGDGDEPGTVRFLRERSPS